MTESDSNIKIIFFGTGRLGLPTLEHLFDVGLGPSLVVTTPDRPAGRGLKIKHCPIKDSTLKHKIPILQPENINDPEVAEQIKQYRADLGLIIAYGQKINSPLINMFPKGIINLHASLLPRYRGAAPVNWAIINGEEQTGLTVMQIDEEIDTGMILTKVSTKIKPLERTDELYDRLSRMAPDLVVETIGQIWRNSIKPIPQDPTKATRAPKLKKSLSQFDWSLPAEKIEHLARGLWPWPTATTTYMPAEEKKKPVKIALARVRAIDNSNQQTSSPGTILDDLSVATGAGRLQILELKPAGSKLMTWKDFVNGRHVKAGDTFISDMPSQK